MDSSVDSGHLSSGVGREGWASKMGDRCDTGLAVMGARTEVGGHATLTLTTLKF